MGKRVPEPILQSVLVAIADEPGGRSLIQVAAALSPPPPLRNVQRWLAILARQQRVVRIGDARSARYRLASAVAADPPAYLTPIAQAVHRLVSQPVAQRPPADYRRIMLGSYIPNETRYSPEELAAELRGAGADAVGADGATAWREAGAFAALTTEIVWRGCWLEHVLGGDRVGGGTALSQAEVGTMLAQPETPVAQPPTQLAWGVRAAWLKGFEPGDGSLRERLTVMHGLVARSIATAGKLGLAPGIGFGMPLARANQRDEGVASPGRQVPAGKLGELRTGVLALADTEYRPPADPILIESSYRQVLELAEAVADPVEQGFFLFVHLLYLLPYALANGPMAMLALNLPLARAGLRPVTLAMARDGDLLAGIRGVWELNRVELLREVVCEDVRVARAAPRAAPRAD